MTPRWFNGPAHKGRIDFYNSTARFVFNHSGRRSWKTETAKRRMVRRFVANPGRYLAAAPTNKQAKRIFWEDFKKLTPGFMVGKISEGEMFIRLKTGAELHVAGMDAPDRVEGQMWNHVLLDEYGNMAERVWPEVISPVLADTGGGCDFIGVPEGRNHYYDLIHKMRHRKDVSVFHWPSWEILPAEEIEVQRSNLDELTFAQEFGGEFVHFAGRAYYAFDERTHCQPVRDIYDKRAPIVFCFDFNVDPGVAAVCQERRLPNGLDGTAVIGEVYIPKNSNTEVVARKLVEDWRGHEGRVSLYGDFTGGARGSAKVQGSDWEIIKRILRPAFGERLSDRVTVNPAVRDRINAMNGRLKATNGDIRMMVDPRFAPHVIKDLEGVTLIEGSAGEIDKNSAPQLSHMCFAAETLVETADGVSRMSDLPSSGLVRGFDGSFVPYEKAGKTGENKPLVAVSISVGSVVYCTPEHQWLTDSGWKSARNLKGHRLITSESLSRAGIDRNSMGRRSTATTARSDISGAQTEEASNIFTALFTSIFSVRSLKDSTFITATETGPITRLKIWNALRQSSIFRDMRQKIRKDENGRANLGWPRRGRLQENGTLAMRAGSGTVNTLAALRKMFNRAPFLSYVSIADANSYLSSGMQNIAAGNASLPRDTIQNRTMNREVVRRAQGYLKRINTPAPSIAADYVLDVLDVRTVKSADVYCLFVESDGCFALANGAVVSNSDALGYYVNAEFGYKKHQTIVSHGGRFA